MITWDAVDTRYFHHGVDRGVLYPNGLDPVAWNGVTGVDESGNGSSSTYYIDGVVYLSDMDATDFSGTLTAYDFPDDFGVCIGMPQIADGLIIDNQKPKRFNLSYRSLVGSGTGGDMFGYQIHLVYNCLASIGVKSRKTLNDSPSPLEFTFGITCTPVKLSGFRPSAHYIIDTRRLDPETIAYLEGILYGATEEARLPTPTELYELLSFGDNIVVTNYDDETFNVKGKRANVYMTDAYHFQVDNINAADNGDGTYTITDGGTTTVVDG